jgi:serine protease
MNKTSQFRLSGTHVAGTIAALGGNNRGVRGMIADGGICLVIGRVFSNSGGSASSSAILTAVEWAVQSQKANVVSMSLGGPGFSETESRFYQNLANAGVIVAAAAGNDGTSEMTYPASYSSVISVAAVDSSRNRASFSQYNSQVDLAAPGVDVLSTVPMGTGGLTTLTLNGGTSFTTEIMTRSSSPAGGVSGPLVDCGLGTSKCPGGSGHICLIERCVLHNGGLPVFQQLRKISPRESNCVCANVNRGGNTFEQKAMNCQAGGGKAAIVFNYDSSSFSGVLASPTSVVIPTISASGLNGQTLKSSSLGKVVTLRFETGYASYDGTSMATPHVSGAVASIWRQCRQCSNSQVVQCLKTTAQDLGSVGYDVQYGHGLIQTKAAFDCLKSSCCS